MCPRQWNGAWPIHLTKDSPKEQIECPALDTDRHHLRHLHNRTYMAAVSPWFFTVWASLSVSRCCTSFRLALSALWSRLMEQKCKLLVPSGSHGVIISPVDLSRR